MAGARGEGEKRNSRGKKKREEERKNREEGMEEGRVRRGRR